MSLTGRLGKEVDPTRGVWAKVALGLPPEEEVIMAKSQKKSSRETRKPKAEKPPKQNASNPSQKAGVVSGLENMKH